MFGFVIGFALGLAGALVLRYGAGGFYTVNPDERAVLTSFGRADRLGAEVTTTHPISASLRPEERERYRWPQVRVVGPGGPYFKLPWQRVHKVSVATQTVSIAYDPDTPSANKGGRSLEAVTKDQLNTGLTGQLRFTISEKNLYAYLFGVKNPIAHVMGYFVSILRERIANFEAPPPALDSVGPDAALRGVAAHGISINDLRKNLRDLNETMDRECDSAAARYGIELNAALITEIDPPPDIESALAAINTAYNQVSAEISLAQASADQKIVQSRRAVEIQTLNAQAEAEPLRALAGTLRALRESGAGALQAYLRNVRLALLKKADLVVLAKDSQGGAA